jgi:hypothetical protein
VPHLVPLTHSPPHTPLPASSAAFTPGCSATHLPGFVKQADAIKAKNVDDVYCVSVNDAFVMAAWAKDQHAEGKVRAPRRGECRVAATLFWRNPHLATLPRPHPTPCFPPSEPAGALPGGP